MKTFKRNLLLLISLMIPTLLGAQTPIDIKGRILNKDKQPVVSCAVFLMKKEAIIKTTESDREGVFLFQGIKSDNYYLRISHGNYSDFILPLNYLESSVSVGDIFLSKKVNVLDEVIINSSDDKLIKKQSGKIIIKLNNDLLNDGASINEILDNLPTVDIDERGNISMRGDNEVVVYLNGKITQLNLDQISLINIDKIELISNPSVKWGADGASIINVITKNKYKRGLSFTSNFNYSISKFSKYRGGGSLNYSTSYMNIKSNLSTYSSKNFFEGLTNDFGKKVFQRTVNINRDKGFSLSLGLDFFLNRKNHFFVEYKRNYSSPESSSTFKINGKETSLHNTDYDYNSFNFNLGYKKIIDVDNHFLDFELYLGESPKEREKEFVFDGVSTSKLFSYYYLGNSKYRQYNIDYHNQLSANSNLDLGFQLNTQKVYQDLQNVNLSDLFIPSSSLNYIFNRKIFAGYLDYSGNYNRWNINLGLRLENVSRSLLLNRKAESLEYLKAYPRVQISNNINEKKVISFVYNKRIVRPQHWQLTNIPKYFSPTLYAIRNPKLKPSIINSLNFSYNYKSNNFNISTDLYYKHYTKRISQIQRVSERDPNLYVFTLENMNKHNSIGIELIGGLKVNDWFRTSSTIEANNSKISMSINNELIEKEFVSYSFRSYNKLIFNKNFFQLNFRYLGNIVFPQGKRKPLGKLDLAYNRKIFNNNGSFTVKLLDVFNTYSPTYEIITDDSYRIGEFFPESRRLQLSIVYNFQSKIKKDFKRKKRISIEKNDINGVQF